MEKENDTIILNGELHESFCLFLRRKGDLELSPKDKKKHDELTRIIFFEEGYLEK
ncbi:MAG: hypothetical protein ACLFTW_15665 [Chitinispirillaceae bacterium]